MKKSFKRTIRIINNSFNRIIDKESQRVFEFNTQMLESNSKEVKDPRANLHVSRRHAK